MRTPFWTPSRSRRSYGAPSRRLVAWCLASLLGLVLATFAPIVVLSATELGGGGALSEGGTGSRELPSTPSPSSFPASPTSPASPARTSAAMGWSSSCDPCSPGALSNASMTYDPLGPYVLLFGGESAAGVPQGATWTFSAGTWTEVCASCGPSPRYGASMAYDDSHYDDYVVLFGGWSGSHWLNDTWKFSGGSWTNITKQVCPHGCPSARSGAATAWDGTDNEVVMAGGCGPTCPLNDSWSYAYGNWTQICKFCPFAPRSDASMAWDSADGYVLLVGGAGPSRDLNDSWYLAHGGTTWEELCAACGPSPRADASAVWDSEDGYVLLFGGFNSTTGSGQDPDTWDFTAGGWYNLSLSTFPSAREGAAIADDPVDREVVLYGGSSSSGGALPDSWTYDYGMTVATPTASPIQIENGQTVKFSTSLAGGSGTYTVAWLNLPTGCSSANVVILSCTPTGVTTNQTFPIQVLAVDANHNAVLSAVAPFTVLGNPATPFVISSVPSGALDSGQSVLFSTLANGGSGVYSFAWSGLPTGCSSANLRVLPCTPTGIAVNTSFGVSVVITDSNGFSAGSGTLTFQVNNDTWVAPILESRSVVESGQKVNFTTSATGGAGGYRFVWSGLPHGCPNVTTDRVDCVVAGYPANTTGVIGVSVVDLSGFSASGAPTSLRIIAGPAVSTPHPSSPSIDSGQSVAFRVTATEGVGNYSFVWLGLPAGCVSVDAVDLSCTPSPVSSNATFSISVDATDSNGQVATGSPLLFQVNGDPSVSSIVASPSLLDSGQSVTLEVAATRGSGGYTFAWTGLPTGCVSVSLPVWTCHPTGIVANTTFQVGVTATDSDGMSATSSTLALSVDGAMVVSTPVASPSGIDAGQLVSLRTTASVGAGGYHFLWSGLPTGCSSENTPDLLCRPAPTASNATYSVSVTVTDAAGLAISSSSLALSVDAEPAVVSATLQYAEIDLGSSMVATLHADEGAGGYSFLWTGSPPGCPASSGLVLTCQPLALGRFDMNISAEDARDGVGAPLQLNLTVVEPPEILAFVSTANEIRLSQNSTFSVVVHNGVAPFTYLYTGLPAGCSSQDVPALECGPDVAGTFKIGVIVTDLTGVSTNASLTWEVISGHPGSFLFGLPSTEGFLLVGVLAALAIIGLLVVVPLVRGDLFRPEDEERGPEAGEGEATDESEESPPEDVGMGPPEEASTEDTVEAPEELAEPEPTEDIPSSEVSPTDAEEGPTPEEESAGVSGIREGTPEVPEPSTDPALDDQTTPGAAERPQPPTEGPTSPPDAVAGQARRCPMCGGPLDGDRCPNCDLDFSLLQVEGRTDTLKRPPRQEVPR